MTTGRSRRDVLRMGGLAAATGLLGPTLASAAPPAAPASASLPRRRSLRVAHLTDFHIQPERRAAEGVAACLKHVQSHADKPALILTGGDLIMDGYDSDEARTRLQWDLYTKTLKDHCGIPVQHCLGNHDIWGWNKGKSGTTGKERAWGKVWAVETLGLPRRYYSFDAPGNAWHIVVLDSVQPDPVNKGGYIGRVDDEQWDWLENDLKASASKPTLIVSHIPILSVTPVCTDADRKSLERRVPGGLMHTDTRRLIDLFARTRPASGPGGVRCCVSGHMHLVDRAEYDGVTYLCDGAVCGAWWKGKHQECSEGYALLDLFDDGTVDRTYVQYGWQVEPT